MGSPRTFISLHEIDRIWRCIWGKIRCQMMLIHEGQFDLKSGLVVPDNKFICLIFDVILWLVLMWPGTSVIDLRVTWWTGVLSLDISPITEVVGSVDIHSTETIVTVTDGTSNTSGTWVAEHGVTTAYPIMVNWSIECCPALIPQRIQKILKILVRSTHVPAT